MPKKPDLFANVISTPEPTEKQKNIVAKKYSLHPTPGRLLVEEDTFHYEGVIVVPDGAKRRPTTGTVIEVNVVDGGEAPPCVVGDKVLYAQYSGTGIRLRGQVAYRVLGFAEILLVIEGEVEIEDAGA